MLELDRLTRRFGGNAALDGFTCSIPAGAVLGFLGPNGAGKTTAMRIVMGILAPDSGEVRWQGRRITADDHLRFGYLPEERGLYPRMIVLDQLVYLGRLHGMSETAARTSATSWLDRLGLADRAGDNLEALSLGNQQRVQLAAALVHSPDLLVLDEPFSGLDPVGIDALSSVLEEEAKRGVTVLFSSHQLDLVEDLCEQVVVIHRGRLVAAGAVADLTAGDGRSLVVEVDGDEAGTWAARLKGVTVTPLRGGRVRVQLPEGRDPETVLRAARRGGVLRHFEFERVPLSQVFRNAIAS
ncbi:MAG TPA: ATP-binding cassette domain-containing protein [Acidimicrobiales bacterium]|nr:ATP-binding cassette domain-containing protein [Acidimicrobiales bacterium]